MIYCAADPMALALTRPLLVATLPLAAALAPSLAGAQSQSSEPDPLQIRSAAPPATDRPEITVTGSAEAYYSYNLNAPSNGLNSLRFYDTLHDQVALNNVSFEVASRIGPVSTHAVFQLGAIATVAFAPSATLARTQQELLWRVVQEVTIGWTPRLLGRTPLTLEGGLFVAPFGVEWVQIYKNWTWSPSNFFYIAPFQMTGLRATWRFTDRFSARAGVYSGWDQVVDDNNDFRTVLLQAEYSTGEDLTFSAQYMCGIERERFAPEGPWVRHTFDVYTELRATRRLQLRGHVFAGFEPNRIGLNAWASGALSARFKILEWLFVAARADVVGEWYPARGQSLFGIDGSNVFGAGTFTVELLPHSHVSLRLEYRHDHADGALYYRDSVPRDRRTGLDVANATWQDTFLLGTTAWF